MIKLFEKRVLMVCKGGIIMYIPQNIQNSYNEFATFYFMNDQDIADVDYNVNVRITVRREDNARAEKERNERLAKEAEHARREAEIEKLLADLFGGAV